MVLALTVSKVLAPVVRKGGKHYPLDSASASALVGSAIQCLNNQGLEYIPMSIG